MANGQSFGQIVSNMYYTSVGASFVTGALVMPGISTGAKAATASAIAIDVAVDANVKREVYSIGGVIGEYKPLNNATIDTVSSVVLRKVVNNVTSGINKAISSDLGSSTAVILIKETKSTLKQIQVTASSTVIQTGANAVADYVGGVVGGQVNEVVGISSTPRVPAPLKDSNVQLNEAVYNNLFI